MLKRKSVALAASQWPLRLLSKVVQSHRINGKTGSLPTFVASQIFSRTFLVWPPLTREYLTQISLPFFKGLLLKTQNSTTC